MLYDEPLSQNLWLSARSLDDAAWMIRRVWEDTKCPSIRKSQLFAIACARHVWHLLTDERLRQAVEIAEKYADGLATEAEVDAVVNVVGSLHWNAEHNSSYYWLTYLACIVANPRLNPFNYWKAPNSLRILGIANSELPVLWIRDIFGSLWFRPIFINPNWLTPTVTNLAFAAYEHRALPYGELDTTSLEILADALEDEGCDNQEILGHLRGSGPHFRGCFALDLLLGLS
jgi:hypothetical protein